MHPDAASGAALPGVASERRHCSVLVCDLADSTALVEGLGDEAAAALIQQHDRLFRSALRKHGGTEIDKTDGFLALFDRASAALAFARAHRRALQQLGSESGQRVQARFGLHSGDVQVWRNREDEISRGAKPVEVEGLAKPIAARLMSLAQPGQILLSPSAAAECAAPELTADLQNHGEYRLKGIAGRVSVLEYVGDGDWPRRRPRDNDKAWRHVPLWRRLDLHARAAVLLLAVTGIVLLTQLGARAQIDFKARDWALLAELENTSGEALLDGALEAALRVGLEQSRHINLIPETRARQVLLRMERPADAPLDRATAVELALREQLAAVLLPSVTAVGGQLRLSIEVIHPASGRTVFVETADARGLDEVLGRADQVLGRVRARLGESINDLGQDSLPLEQVTTGNLEALKAFSLGLKASASQDAARMMALYRRALELDPEFAAVHAKLGALALVYGDNAEARRHFERAARTPERLTARERLYVQGHLASFDSPLAAAERWLQLATLYPDFVTGQQNYALSRWTYFNDFEEAEHWFREVIASSSPLRVLSMHTLGSVLLGQQRFDEARQSFAEAEALGAPRLYLGEVDVELAAGDLDAAQHRLDLPLGPREISYTRQARLLRQIALDLERGQLRRALQRVESATSDQAQAIWSPALLRAQLLAWSAAPEATNAIDEALGELAARASDGDPANAPTYSLDLLELALAAARSGHREAAETAARLASSALDLRRFPDLDAMHRTVLAELALLEGRPLPAMTLLQEATELTSRYQTVYTRLRIEHKIGMPQASESARWLQQRRGQAYAEVVGRWRLPIANVLAVQSSAAILLAVGDDDEYSAALAQRLASAWAEADPDWPPLNPVTPP